MLRLLRRFRVGEAGATAIEYGMIAALIFLVILVAVTAVGNASSSMWTRIATHVSGASP